LYIISEASSGLLLPLDAFNRLSHEQMHRLWGREKDAIASSDYTKWAKVQWEADVSQSRGKP